MHGDVDIAIIGAGIAGLACAQRLQQSGYQTVVVEKSRGFGGRLATRRIQEHRADHGAAYLTPQGPLFQSFINHLADRQILHIWTDRVHALDQSGHLQQIEQKACYVATDGMTAIAKFLATGLDVRRNQRVTQLERQAELWQILSEQPSDRLGEPNAPILAKAVVIAIPAPQAVELLSPADVPQNLISTLKSISFTPCLTAIAGYPSRVSDHWAAEFPDVCAIQFPQDDVLAWAGLDSSKRPSQTTVVGLQSTVTFAREYLEATDLTAAADRMVQQLASHLAPWLTQSDWVQIHRWRYAFPESPLSERTLLGLTSPPLLCAGDWCGGKQAEQAFLSGLAVAEQVSQLLNKNAIAPADIWNAIAIDKPELNSVKDVT